ncbi:hypothetical protein FACS189414_5470 [Bacteroidia bacterium]|nr:hypothetical protein AGMMS49574_01980 [Bacteroidia bacterium]GHU78260.1 hypothetical protein FACS189414_5470 [Bacteroidia bacterium]
MDDKNKDRKDEWPDDDQVIYIPDQEYHCFMQSLRKLEEAQKEFLKIRDNMKPLDNGELKVES